MRTALLNSPLVLLLFAVLIASSGCDNSIEPLPNRSTFSIYGYLNLSEQRQFIRVKDVNEPLLGDSASQEIDAAVTLEELSTGTTWALRDSVIAFGDLYTHNFWADLTLQPDTEYRVTVTRSDGVTTRATTRTPRAIAPVSVPEAGNCLTNFSIPFPGIQDRQRIYEVQVGFLPERETDGPSGPPGPGDDRPTGDAPNQERVWVDIGDSDAVQLVSRRDTDVQIRLLPEELLAPFLPSIDTRPMNTYIPRCLLLDDDQFYVAYVQLGPNWSGVLSRQSISFNLGESLYVDNGLGFLGALRYDTLTVTVDTANAIVTTPDLSGN
jgi:hypothetical protein